MLYYKHQPNFEKLPARLSYNETFDEFLEIIMNNFTELYDIDFGSDGIDKFPFLSELVSNGVIGVAELDGELYYGHIVRGGTINKNGVSDVKAITTLNGKTINLAQSQIVEIKLSPSGNEVLTFSRFASRLAEVDVSQRTLVKATRAKSIIVADTDNEKTAINAVLEDAADGINTTIVKDSDLFRDDTTGTSKKIDINDPAMFQSMEYLSSYHAELCRRLYGLYGFSMQGKNKQAQVTTDELDDMELPSVIYPLMHLHCLEEGIEKVNKSFTRNWSIKPSKLLQRVLDDVFIKNAETEPQEEGEDDVDN